MGYCSLQKELSIKDRMLAIVLLMALMALAASRLVLPATNQTQLALPTSDYFSASYPQFNYSNSALIRVQRFQRPCEPVFSIDDLSSRLNTSKVLVFVDLDDAFQDESIRCVNYRQVVERVASAASNLQTNVAAVIMGATKNTELAKSGGYRFYFQAKSLKYSDREPTNPVAVFLQSAQEARLVADAIKQAEVLTNVVLLQEAGPWNSWYNSTAHKLVKLAFGAVNGAAVLYAVHNMVRNAPVSHFQLKHGLYVAAILATMCTIASIVMVPRSLAWEIADTIGNTLFSVCFYAVLIIWLKRLKQVRIQTFIETFTFVVYAALILAFIRGLYAFILLLGIRLDRKVQTWSKFFFSVTLVPSQIMCGLVFLICVIQYMRFRYATFLPPQSKSVLFRFTIISAVGSFTFLFIAAQKMIMDATATHNEFTSAIWALYFRWMSSTLRALAFLLALPLDVANKL
jgi:hypothetical protein